MSSTLIVGGGPAGMMCAYSALTCGSEVLLIEQNEKLGKKLFLTGKGRCNITNACDIEDILGCVPKNAKFLYSALYTFTNDSLIKLLNENGLPTKVERGGRVFPASDKSSDVISTLIKLIKGCEVKLNTRVLDLIVSSGSVVGVKTNKGDFYADKIVLATGGFSYPSTGSRGDGHKLAHTLGHNVTDIHPSLIPLEIHGDTCKRLQGLSLLNVELGLVRGSKTLYKERGEMLFTHFGISGPLVLSCSAHIDKYSFEDLYAVIDLKPALDESKLDARLLRDFEENKNRLLKNALSKLLPSKLIDVFIEKTGIHPETPMHSITKAQRQAIAHTLKHFELKIKNMRPIAEAIITRGGVDIRSMDPSTMQSKHIKNLYFAGEIIDVDAYTGGYNLQIAFSTGYLAGQNL